MTFCPAVFDLDVFALDEPAFTEAFQKGLNLTMIKLPR